MLGAKGALDIDETRHSYPRIAEVPFDSTRKRMTTVHAHRQGGVLVATKGALEAVLAVTSKTALDGQPSMTTTEARRAADGYAANGYRVLAMAGTRRPDVPERAADAERDLTLYGLVAMADATRDEYLRLLSERTGPLLREGKPPEYPKPMTAAWQLSVEKLKENLPEAMELLRCCAFFGPEPIPRDLFFPVEEGRIRPEMAELMADPIRLSKAIGQLGRYALVRLDSANRTIQVHRLIQALLREELDEMVNVRRAEVAARIRQTDPRPFPCLAVYAVDHETVVGQVGVFRLPMISTSKPFVSSASAAGT